jgi:alkylation response protein AidB-like acyl-CoA dehydrogenase
MNFGYTQEQQQLRKEVRQFAETEIKPHVMEWDESQQFPVEVFRKLGELGVLGAVYPEEFGGSGFTYVDYSIVMEELARVDPSIALSAAAHISLCMNHIYLAGSREQKQKYLPKLASGEWIGAWALTEPESGSDAGGTHTRAVRDPKSDCWVLNGSKTFTTNGQIADVVVVMAVTDRAATSHGISAFLIEKGTPGFRPGKKENKLGMRCSPTNEMILSDCRVPDSQRCGNLGEGFIDALRVLDGGRISIAALSLGIAQGAYEAALHYSQQRKQFGRFISEFQAIQHKLADMATEIDAARLLTLRAAWMKDNGMNVNKESSMAKLFASEIAVRVANEAVQIHGGYGFTKDYPVEKFYRDVKLCTIGEGTSEIQKLVIARQLLKSNQRNG